jgi:hypothetical protein
MQAFLRQILVINGIALVLIGSALAYLLPIEHFLAFLLAIAITFANAIVGCYYIDQNFDASFNDFMSTVFGSMFFRLFALGVLITLLLIFSATPQITFTLSLFISYICNSVLEFIFINRKSAKKS